MGVARNDSFFIIGRIVAFSYDEQNIVDDIEPIFESLGFKLVDLKMKTIKGTAQIHLVVFKDDGVSIEDCSEMYKILFPRLEVLLDKEDIKLEVSSPGIGRVFKDRREYYIFSDIPVALLLQNESEWKNGVIHEVHDDFLEFDEGNGKYTIDFEIIRKAKTI